MECYSSKEATVFIYLVHIVICKVAYGFSSLSIQGNIKCEYLNIVRILLCSDSWEQNSALKIMVQQTLLWFPSPWLLF